MSRLTFGQKLKKIRAHLGIRMSKMADTMGVIKSNMSRYERDLNKPSIEFVALLLKHYDVNLNWLFGKGTRMFNSANDDLFEIPALDTKKKKVAKKETVTIEYTNAGIPIFFDTLEIMRDKKEALFPISGEISAGPPMEIRNTEPLDYVPAPFQKGTRDLSDYLVFRVNGLSMAPDIAHEDIVFIRKCTDWFDLNGKIVAVMIQGEMTLKKLLIKEEKQEVIFKPLNKDFQDITVSFDLMDATFLVGELKAIRRVYSK